MQTFAEVNRNILDSYKSTITDWLPGGKFEGSEYVVKNPTRPDKNPGSFKINVDTALWADYATGDTGNDPISLYAYINNLSQGDALKILSYNNNAIPESHYKLGYPTKKYEYKNESGVPIAYSYRFETSEGKTFRPLSIVNGKWVWKAPNPPILYNLDQVSITDKDILLVEGEKSADAANTLFCGKLIATTCFGGCKKYKYTDVSCLTNKKVIIWPDADDPGRKAAIDICNNIDSKHLKIIDVPKTKPKGWDIYDFISEGASLSDVISFVKSQSLVYEKPKEKKQISKSKQEIEYPFRFLGQNHGTYYYLPFSTGQIVALTASKHTDLNLMQLAPRHFWDSTSLGDSGLSTREWKYRADELMRKSHALPIYNQNNVRAMGVWCDRERIVHHIGCGLIVDNREIEIKNFNTSYIYEKGPGVICHNYTNSVSESNKLREICKLLPFKKSHHADLFAGWLVCSHISGALTWRPHLWLTAARQSGKSWILSRIVRPVLGDEIVYFDKSGGTTAAGIRQKLHSCAWPVVGDEMETHNKTEAEEINRIIDLSRGSSSGATTLKGTADGFGLSFHVNSCFLFASIGVGLKNAADLSRFCIIELEKPNSWSKEKDQFERLSDFVNKTITSKWCRGFRARTRNLTKTIIENSKIFGRHTTSILKGSARLGDQIGTLIAGVYSLTSDGIVDDKKAIDWISKQNWEQEKQQNEDSDEGKLYNHIMGLSVKIYEGNGVVERNIGELIETAKLKDNIDIFFNEVNDSEVVYDKVSPTDARKTLSRIGIKVTEGENKILIANSHAGLERLLKNSQWQSWGRILKRLPGAKVTAPKRIGGVLTRFVEIDTDNREL